MEENADKMHFKFTAFNSAMRVTVYAECIYLLAEYLKYLTYEGYLLSLVKCGGSEKRRLLCEHLVTLSTVRYTTSLTVTAVV